MCSSLPCWEMPTQTDGTPTISAASGPANSVVSLMTTSGPHARQAARMPGKAARASMRAKTSPTTRLAVSPSVFLPRTSAKIASRSSGGRVVEGPQRQALGADHRGGLARSGDEDVGAGALEGAGEGDQRAEVTGPGLGRHENAHDRSDAGARAGFL